VWRKRLHTMIMKICTFNVNGIRQICKKGTLQTFLSTHRPDILCLQEVKATFVEDIPSLPGYTMVSNQLSTVKKGYSGVVIYVNNMHIRSVHHEQDMVENWVRTSYLKNESGSGSGSGSGSSSKKEQIVEALTEGRICTLRTSSGWLVINVYTPNSGSGNGVDALRRLDYRVEVWDTLFSQFLQHCKELYKNKVIVCGDLNVARTKLDIAKPGSNVHRAGYTERERKSFERMLDATSSVDLFRHVHGMDAKQYTFWSYMGQARAKNIGWRIDYMLVDKTFATNVSSFETLSEVLGSDHCPIVATMNIDI